MGNKGGGNQYDFFIQQEEFKLQIILCSVADIKGGFFYLDNGEYITDQKVHLGFLNMHNPISQSLIKTESVQKAFYYLFNIRYFKVFDKFITPFKENNQYLFRDLLIALFLNSRSSTIEKARSVAQLYFKNKDELNQAEIIFLFKKIFKSILSYSFAVINKFGDEQREFDKPKSQEEEDQILETEETLYLLTGQNLAEYIGETLVEKDKTLTIAEFAEKCNTYIPQRFYRDIFNPKLLRAIVYRDYQNLDQIDREIDEKENKKNDEKKQLNDEKDNKENGQKVNQDEKGQDENEKNANNKSEAK